MNDLFDFELSEEEKATIINIAFAALINAYGKPIEISRETVDALPDHFTLTFQDTDTGRKFWVEKDKDNEQI